MLMDYLTDYAQISETLCTQFFEKAGALGQKINNSIINAPLQLDF